MLVAGTSITSSPIQHLFDFSPLCIFKCLLKSHELLCSSKYCDWIYWPCLKHSPRAHIKHKEFIKNFIVRVGNPDDWLTQDCPPQDCPPVGNPEVGNPEIHPGKGKFVFLSKRNLCVTMVRQTYITRAKKKSKTIWQFHYMLHIYSFKLA